MKGEEIKRLRKAAKLTQIALAQRAEISHPTVQRAERSDPTVTRRMLTSIARALSVDLRDIYDDPTPGAGGSLGVDLSPVLEAIAEQAAAVEAVTALVEDVPGMLARFELLMQDMAVVRAYVDAQTAATTKERT